MATTLDAVKAWLKLAGDDELLTPCVEAANVIVGRYAGDVESGDLALAATMLAARLYRRRNSPEGVQGITDGGAVYIARNDPDIARLLRIGRPAVG